MLFLAINVPSDNKISNCHLIWYVDANIFTMNLKISNDFTKHVHFSAQLFSSTDSNFKGREIQRLVLLAISKLQGRQLCFVSSLSNLTTFFQCLFV